MPKKGDIVKASDIGFKDGTVQTNLNADLIDGIDSSKFLRNDQNGSLTGTLTVSGDIKAASFTVGSSTIIETDGKIDYNKLKNLPASYTPTSHNHDDLYYRKTELNTSGGGGQVHWNNITSKPTSVSGAGLTDVYTKTEVDTKFTNLIGAAPTTLDTLNELATALGNDPNFATTLSTQIGLKANSADVYLKTDVYTKTELQTSGSSSVHWNNITNKPTYDNYGSWTLKINTDAGQTVGSSGVVDLKAGSNTAISRSGNTITISSTDTNTTYTASDGVQLVGTDIRHGSIAAATSLTAAGRKYVTGLTFDKFGHVTGYTTGTETVVDTNDNNYLTGVSGSGNGTVTFTRGGTSALANLTWDASHNHTLDGLSNVTITGKTNGQVLKWNGTAWVNTTLAASDIPDATTAQKGVVQLNDTVTSTSIALAATANSVKTAYDLANAALPKAGGSVTGNLGIGQAAGTEILEVAGNIKTTGNNIRIESTTAPYLSIGSGSSTSPSIRFRSTGTEGWMYWNDTTDVYEFKTTNGSSFAPISATNLTLATGGGYINGPYGEMMRSTDEWLRINDGSSDRHTNGVYMGSSIVRTDIEFQVGSSGGAFRATSAGVVTASASVTAPTVTANQVEVKSSSTANKFTLQFNSTENSLDFVFA